MKYRLDPANVPNVWDDVLELYFEAFQAALGRSAAARHEWGPGSQPMLPRHASWPLDEQAEHSVWGLLYNHGGHVEALLWQLGYQEAEDPAERLFCLSLAYWCHNQAMSVVHRRFGTNIRVSTKPSELNALGQEIERRRQAGEPVAKSCQDLGITRDKYHRIVRQREQRRLQARGRLGTRLSNSRG